MPKVSPGGYNIFVVDNYTQTSDSTTFYVLPLTPAQIKIENISPMEGYPGTFVFIMGHGATPKGEVRIFFDRLNVANTNAYEDGCWSTSFNVPDVAPGNYAVLAWDVSSNTSDSVMFSVLEMEMRNVGVKEGDWAKYNVVFNYSTNDPNPPISSPGNMFADVDYLLIRIVSVVKTNVTYESAIRYKNGTEMKSVSWLDVSTGLSFPGFSMPYGPIIAANLTAGDKIYLNAYSPTINSTLMALYAGLEREVNCYLQELNMTITPNYITFGNVAMYWDRLSGILCEQKAEVHYVNVEKRL